MSKVTKNDVGKRVTVEKKGEVGSPGSTVNRARTRTHRTLFPLCVFLFKKDCSSLSTRTNNLVRNAGIQGVLRWCGKAAFGGRYVYNVRNHRQASVDTDETRIRRHSTNS